jgi:hypothetical protein
VKPSKKTDSIREQQRDGLMQQVVETTIAILDVWDQYRMVDARKMAKVRCARAAARARAWREKGDERRAAKAWQEALRWDAIAFGIAEKRDKPTKVGGAS